MKPIVVLGMAQPYPGYGSEQVTIVASRILDTIVAFGQTSHNIHAHLGLSLIDSFTENVLYFKTIEK
jgi:hypothetical protein